MARLPTPPSNLPIEIRNYLDALVRELEKNLTN